MPPPSSGRGARRVHSTTLSSRGLPEATPSVKGSEAKASGCRGRSRSGRRSRRPPASRKEAATRKPHDQDAPWNRALFRESCSLSRGSTVDDRQGASCLGDQRSADGRARQPGGADGGTRALVGGKAKRLADRGRDQARPQRAARAAAGQDDALDPGAVGCQRSVAVGQRQSDAFENGLHEMKRPRHVGQARESGGQQRIVVRRALAGKVGREDRRGVRRQARRFDLCDQRADVAPAEQARDPRQRGAGAQHDGMLGEEARHGVAMGVHAAAVCRHEAIVGDEVDARRSQADVGGTSLHRAHADARAHIVSAAARHRRAGRQMPARRQVARARCPRSRRFRQAAAAARDRCRRPPGCRRASRRGRYPSAASPRRRRGRSRPRRSGAGGCSPS